MDGKFHEDEQGGICFGYEILIKLTLKAFRVHIIQVYIHCKFSKPQCRSKFNANIRTN